MNRYDITNNQNGNKFSYEADSPIPDQPEWGQGYALVVTDITAAKAAADAARAARIAIIKNAASAATVADLKALLVAIVKHLGLDQ